MTPYYQDDHCTIYHGDCREVDAGLAADVLVTDPPYGIGYVNGGARVNANGVRSRSAERLPVVNDADTTVRDDAINLWGGRPALIFGTWKAPRPHCTQRLLWIKANTTPCLGSTPWSSADEEIYVLGDGWVGERDLNIKVTTEARAGTGGLASQIGHPTPKPLDLMRWLIARAPAGVVADPFTGSGSTLEAAKQMGRKAIGIEIEERYCEIAAKRLAQEVLPL